MKNLKITISLDSPAVLDRYTTIDSILLSLYYRFLEKNGKKLPFDPEHKTVNFIEKKNGVFSGSIWYVEKDEQVYFDFDTIIKKPEYEKIFEVTGKRAQTDSKFKQALVTNELIVVEKIYFYIKAEKDIVENILNKELASVGKYGRLCYGKVSKNGIKIEEINEDKGFMINANTASKPLPVSDFSVNSKKVAFARRSAPYWLNENLEACYMPTTSLVEMSDTTGDDERFYANKEIQYISNVNFLYKQAHSDEVDVQEDIDFIEKSYSNFKKHKKYAFEYVYDNKDLQCTFSGDVASEGMRGFSQEFMILAKSAWGDWAYMKNNDFISKESLWCIENLANIGYSIVDSKKWIFVQGKKATDDNRINNFLRNPFALQAPFSINLKDTANAQHISFKGKVSISNAFFYLQYGNTTFSVDTQLLLSAIDEIKSIIEKYPEITKTHLCSGFRDGFVPRLKQKNRDINEKIVMEFQKKYDKNIRNLLAVVSV
jgi:hypothetical protein